MSPAFHARELERAKNDLHVLLRHRLLREAQSLAGLGVIPRWPLRNDDLALAHGKDVRGLQSSTPGHGLRARPDVQRTATRSPTSMKSLDRFKGVHASQR